VVVVVVVVVVVLLLLLSLFFIGFSYGVSCHSHCYFESGLIL
jgi:hypothetical protein